MSKKQAKTEEIYAIAARLFATKGYHATRIQDIADELGLLKGSLYYYFASKEDLLVQLVQSRLGEAHQVVRQIIEGEGNAAAKLQCAIGEHLRLYQQSAHIYALFYYENLAQIHPATAQTVHRRAADYYRQRGDEEKTIHHLLAAGASRHPRRQFPARSGCRHYRQSHHGHV